MPLESTSSNRSRKTAVIPPKEAVLLTLSLPKGKNPRILIEAPKNHFGRGMAFTAFLSLSLILALTGCHSAYVNATVSNQTAASISLVQVEYPSASFGTQTIAPGADFHYRFKVLGSGQMKITYTDAAQHEQKATGPSLNEGSEGALTITVAPDGVHWQPPPTTR